MARHRSVQRIIFIARTARGICAITLQSLFPAFGSLTTELWVGIQLVPRSGIVRRAEPPDGFTAFVDPAGLHMESIASIHPWIGTEQCRRCFTTGGIYLRAHRSASCIRGDRHFAEDARQAVNHECDAHYHRYHTAGGHATTGTHGVRTWHPHTPSARGSATASTPGTRRSRRSPVPIATSSRAHSLAASNGPVLTRITPRDPAFRFGMAPSQIERGTPMPSKAGGGRSGAPPAPKAKAAAGSRVPPVLREAAARPVSSSSAAAHRRPPPSAAAPPKAPSRGHAKQPPTAATAATTSKRPSAGRPAVAAPSPPAEFSAVAVSHALLAEQSAALDLEQLRRAPPPQGVVVAVRVRPIGPVAEGSVREAPSPPVVTMEGQVTRVHSADERAQVHEFRVRVRVRVAC